MGPYLKTKFIFLYYSIKIYNYIVLSSLLFTSVMKLKFISAGSRFELLFTYSYTCKGRVMVGVLTLNRQFESWSGGSWHFVTTPCSAFHDYPLDD